jgi:large subunit ribosomal protein L29
MATAAEISEYDVDELETQLNETRRELFNLRFQLATGQLDNFSRLSHVKRDVARMLTELRAREIAEAEGLAVDEMPGHQAAARLRSHDEELGRTRTTAAERRAAARAEAEEAEAEEAEADEIDTDTDTDEIDDTETDEIDDTETDEIDDTEDTLEDGDVIDVEATEAGIDTAEGEASDDAASHDQEKKA